MHPSLSSILSYLLIDRRGGHRRAVLAHWRGLAETERLSGEAIGDQQSRDLADLLAHAARAVPRFQRLLRGYRLQPGTIFNVLRALPVMRRADIQAAPAEFIAGNAVGAIDDFTGGSTGTPLAFRVDSSTQIAREASLYWANGLAGWRYGERVAMLWGSDRDAAQAQRDRRLERRWWIDNMRWYNAFRMGPDQMRDFHRDLQRFKPHLVVAYAGSLHTYARFLREELGDVPAYGGRKGDLTPDGVTTNSPPDRIEKAAVSGLRYPLKSLVSSAEMLPAEMRKDIEDVFGRPVFDRYGNRECGAIAAECEHHAGLHINEADFILEVDSPDPYSIPGPILITYLRNRVRPFIRYDTGDLGVLTPGRCACGRCTLRLARIAGRQSDNIKTADGRIVHGEYFTHLMYGAGSVREFQFVQETLTDYRLLVVASRCDEALEDNWRNKISEMLGADARLSIEYVAEIPVLASGKRKFTLSKIA